MEPVIYAGTEVSMEPVIKAGIEAYIYEPVM
jgi:hypothetical protein